MAAAPSGLSVASLAEYLQDSFIILTPGTPAIVRHLPDVADSSNITTPSPTGFTRALNSPDGVSCYGNERQLLSDQARFCNNEKLSDIVLLVGGIRYFAHKLILVRSSDVFEKMLSGDWADSNKKELELVEDVACVGVFPRFLYFLYSCRIDLNLENSLPALILADKYNVTDLRNVCIAFACNFIIPKLQLKDVFHVWFQYSTKCYHRRLIQTCIKALAERMDEIIGSEEWESEWVSLDKEQLIEFLSCSDLTVKDEYELWQAVLKWQYSTVHPQRLLNFETNLRDMLEYIRFPMMTAEQVYRVECSEEARKYPEMFQKYFMMAYRYHALSLSQRASITDLNGSSFLLRNYTDLRWDKRIVIHHFNECQKGEEKSFRFSTRASSFPSQTWDWELKVIPKGPSATPDDIRVVLYSNLILDQPRPMEYLLSLVDRKQILNSVSGKKNFSKTRYTIDTELDKKVSMVELCQPDSPLLVDNSLVLQIILKPAE